MKVLTVSLARCLWCALLASGIVFASGNSESQPLWWISPDEGGSAKLTHQQALGHWLTARGCPVGISQARDDKRHAVLVFEVRPHSSGKPWLMADTEGREPLTVHWLVKGSRSVNRLASLEGERIALLGQASQLGYRQPVRLLEQAGVSLSDMTVFSASKYQGAMALLLHGDVFAAALPSPLAKKWRKQNNLVSLAESELSLVAGVWLSPSQAPSSVAPSFRHQEWTEEKQRLCSQALLAMTRSSRRDAKMQVFPEWLSGFRWPDDH